MVSVSVIIPVYNKVSYLQKTMDSILGQSMKNVEVLLIDDQSTDGSYELCTRLYGVLPQVRILQNQVNMGAGSTRNKGIEEASGRYIAFVDADDIIYPNYLKRMYQAAVCQHADIVAECGTAVNKAEMMESSLEARANRVWNLSYMTTSCQKLFSRDFLMRENIRFCEHVFFEDVVFSLESMLVAKNILMLPDIMYEIIDTPESITRGNLLEKVPNYVDSIIKAIKNLSQYMDNIPTVQNDNKVKNILIIHLLRLSIRCHFRPLLNIYNIEVINECMIDVLKKEFGDNYKYVMFLLNWCMCNDTKL